MWTKNLNVIKTKSNHGWNPGGLRYSIEQLKVLMTGFSCIYILLKPSFVVGCWQVYRNFQAADLNRFNFKRAHIKCSFERQRI